MIRLRSIFCVIAFVVFSAQVNAQPAPPLRSVVATRVYSPRFGIETVNGAWSTRQDHGGSLVQVEVVEAGYGTGQSATFDGVPMVEIATVPLIDSQTRSVIGWRRVYELRKQFTSGIFRFRATSIANPIRTLSCQVVVQ
jgi:hypothetical protein